MMLTISGSSKLGKKMRNMFYRAVNSTDYLQDFYVIIKTVMSLNLRASPRLTVIYFMSLYYDD